MERRRKKRLPVRARVTNNFHTSLARSLSLSLSLFSADVAVVNRVAGEAAAEPAAEDGGAWWWWRHGGSPLPDTDAGALPEIKMKATP